MEKSINTLNKELIFVDDVHFDNDKVYILFIDGNEISFPLAWFPKLYYATPLQLSKWRIAGKGLHIRWPELDEVLYVEAFA